MDCILWEGPHARAGEQREEEGAAKTKCYGLTKTRVPHSAVPLGVGRKWQNWDRRSEAEPAKEPLFLS